jgi:PAS domain-containing protein
VIDMTRHLLKLSWLGVLISLLVGLASLLMACSPSRDMALTAGVSFALIGLGSLLLLTYRLIRFRGRVDRFVRQLLNGNYAVGIPQSKRIKDELANQETLLNRLATQLEIYDRLRADRVAELGRMLDAVLRNVACGIMVADIKSQTLKVNPPGRELFQISDEEVPLKAVQSLPDNDEFTGLFDGIVTKTQTADEFHGPLKLSSRTEAKTISAKLLPIKGQDENVSFVVILIG